MNLTAEQLLRIMPRCPADKADLYAYELGKHMGEYEIDTVQRAGCFLGQLALESGELRFWEELADGSVYEGLVKLGNIHPGDGVRYKGRGPIQLTGLANYTAAEEATGYPLVAHPEMLLDAVVGIAVAVWFWVSRDLSPLADRLDIEGITKGINGGLTNLQERRDYTHAAIRELRRTAKLA